MASPNQLQRNKNKKPKASPNQLQRNKDKKPKASPNQLQKNKDKKPKASPNQLQRNKNKGPKKGMSPGEKKARTGRSFTVKSKDMVFRPGKEFFERLKKEEKPFEKQKKFKSYKGTKGMSPGEKKALIGPTKPYTGIEGMSPGEKKARIGSRPGTNFGNNKNKITELSTRILAGGILLGPAAFATRLLYNEYLKRKAELRKDTKSRKKT